MAAVYGIDQDRSSCMIASIVRRAASARLWMCSVCSAPASLSAESRLIRMRSTLRSHAASHNVVGRTQVRAIGGAGAGDLASSGEMLGGAESHSPAFARASLTTHDVSIRTAGTREPQPSCRSAPMLAARQTSQDCRLASILATLQCGVWRVDLVPRNRGQSHAHTHPWAAQTYLEYDEASGGLSA
eukprot:1629909-Rhodomonas_salina.2